MKVTKKSHSSLFSYVKIKEKLPIRKKEKNMLTEANQDGNIIFVADDATNKHQKRC